MKKISLLMALVAAFLLTSCSKQKSTNLIPEDAAFVVRFDVMQTTEKCGIKGEKSELKNWIKDALASSDMSKQAREKILDIVEDPTKSGIDFTEPVFLYVCIGKRGPSDIGFVGDMANEGDLADLLNTIAKENDKEGVEKAKSGARYLELSNEVALIFNSDWFFLGMTDDVDGMVETLTDRIEGIGSLSGHKALEAMCTKKGVMQMLMLYSGFNSIPEMKESRKMMPEGVELEDIAVLADWEMKPGESVVTNEMVCMSKEWEEYIEKTKDMMKPISKEQTQYISDNGLSLFVNIDTKQLTEQVERMVKQLGAEGNMEIIKQLCDDFNGTLALDMYTVDDNGPQIDGYAGTNDTKVLDMALSGLFANDTLQALADNEYAVPTSYHYDWDEDINITRKPKTWGLAGFRNGQTFFATDKDHAFTKPEAAYPTDKIKGVGFFMRFNFQMLNNLQMSEGQEDLQDAFKEVANTFGEAEIYYTDDVKCIVRLTNTDKKKTTIEAIVDLIKTLID